MNAIELKDLYFGYEDADLFKNISLSIKKGEFFGIIGPNGAGKTTLLRLMAGLLKPKKGEISILGKNLSLISRREIAKLIGFVPQESFFAFDFTVFEVVLMGRNPYLKRFQRPRRIDIEKSIGALKFTDTLSLKEREINRISAGEKQRVVLARTLAQDPKIMLLDEATTHLDITHQMKILKILQKLNKKGMTIVFLSHDLNLASLYCSRILLLSKGRIIACNTPEKVIKNELIKSVYSIEPHITLHPETGAPQIILSV